MKNLNAKAWLALAVLAIVMALLLFVPAGTVRYWQAWVYLYDLHGCLGPHDALSPAKGPRAARASDERRSDRGDATGSEAHHVVCVDRLHRSPDRAGARPSFRVDHRAARGYRGGQRARGDRLLSHFPRLSRNTFAAATIQIAENQKVIATGPYAIVRHPMYASGLLYFLGTPLALGSYWGLLPIAWMLPFLIWRLLDEERLLARNLPEYAEYRRKVRYRLVPFVW